MTDLYPPSVQSHTEEAHAYDRTLLARVNYQLTVECRDEPVIGQMLNFRSLQVGIIKATLAKNGLWTCDVTGGPHNEVLYDDYNKLNATQQQALCEFREATRTSRATGLRSIRSNRT